MDDIADLERDGLAFLDAARAAGLSAPVAACPGWDVARLVGHTGKVLERTTILVDEGLESPPDNDRFVRFPADDSAYDRFAGVLTDAVAALEASDPAEPAWNFTGADATKGFWRRRMANEVAVHRADAELAAGRTPAIEAARAVDGIDELLTVMLPFSAPLKGAGLTGSYHLHCTDVEGEWLIVFDDGHAVTTREHAKGDVAVRGPAATLFLWAWNRASVDAPDLESFGDPALVEAWAAVVP